MQDPPKGDDRLEARLAKLSSDLQAQRDIHPGFTIERPSGAWGVYQHSGSQPQGENSDGLILVNPWEDAAVSCMSLEWAGREVTAEDLRENAVDAFMASELIKVIGRFSGKVPDLKPIVRGKKTTEGAKQTLDEEMLIDVTVGGYPRTFLLRVVKVDGVFKTHVIVAGARQSRFSRLEPELRKTVESFKLER